MIDVVLPIYNTPDVEDRCLRYLFHPGVLPEGSRVVLVDDASPDPVTFNAWAERLRATGHIALRNEVNVGPHEAWNVGIRASGRDVVLLGSDSVVPPGLIQRLYSVCIEEGLGVLGAREVQDGDFHSLIWGDLVDYESNQSHEAPVFGPGGITSCCVVQREALDLVGPFDSQFLRTFGDADWQQRAHDLGIQTAVLRNSAVYHGGSVTRKRLGVEADFAVDRQDHLRFLAKWVSRPDVLAKHRLAPERAAKEAKAFYWKQGEQ